MASTTEPKSIHLRLVHIAQRIPGAALMFAVLPLAVLSYMGWYYYGAEHLDKALYSLQQENIQATQQPNWIKSDVVAEVYSQSRLDRISLLDQQATSLIAQAFEANPWVKSTTRVTKAFGGKVRVDVVYRRPAAMVYVVDKDATGENMLRHGVYPVDAETIVLPTEGFQEDFETVHMPNYLVIEAPPRLPPHADIKADTALGDPSVAAAVELCLVLEPVRERLGLEKVQIASNPRELGLRRWILSVTSRGGQRIVWGHPIGGETQGEPSAKEKLEMLGSWMKSTDRSSLLDLRLRGGVVTPVKL